MIIPFKKLTHTVFVGKIAQLGYFLEGKRGGRHQLFDLGQLLTVDLFFQGLTRFSDKNSVQMAFANVEFLRNIRWADADAVIIGNKPLDLGNSCFIFTEFLDLRHFPYPIWVGCFHKFQHQAFQITCDQPSSDGRVMIVLFYSNIQDIPHMFCFVIGDQLCHLRG